MSSVPDSTAEPPPDEERKKHLMRIDGLEEELSRWASSKAVEDKEAEARAAARAASAREAEEEAAASAASTAAAVSSSAAAAPPSSSSVAGRRTVPSSSAASPQTARRRRNLTVLSSVLTHLLTVLLYLYPLSRPHPLNPSLLSDPRPVLDESHIMSHENEDARGTGPLDDVWKNDYWGRPMNGPSSHKSWRPLTVLSFRWLKFEGLGKVWGWAELFSHRLVNVVIHATTAELCSLTALKLFPTLSPGRSVLTRTFVKALFALHPTHVECTANAANRPHILTLMFAAVASDPDVNILVMIIAVAAGLLCGETMVFMLPAAIVTMTAIRWKSLTAAANDDERRKNSFAQLPSALLSLLPRFVLVVSFLAAYLFGRHSYDTLSIPDGLIRPAENPYYSLEGTERIGTYSLVLSAHVGKAFWVDPVGFSHEYGFDCVRKVTVPANGVGLGAVPTPLDDPRLWIPVGLVLLLVVVTCECVLSGPNAIVHWTVLLSWLATLFPVSGFVKVGTSIADRIAVPATYAVCIYGGRALGWFVADFGRGWFRRPEGKGTVASGGGGGVGEGGGQKWSGPLKEWTAVKSAAALILLAFLWIKVDRRASEWMDSLPLLESSLESCPRSAKSNLEVSKIYSGLYPEKFDLKRALSYLELAEEIDPTYCDVHQQFAHCYIQQGRYLEFEERLTQAVMCPFSMGGSVPLWQRYWTAVTSDPATGQAAKRRMDKYQKVINEAVRREVAKEEAEKRRAQQEGRTIMDGEL